MNKKALEDKVVIITGASSGIGRATALRMAQDGAYLVLAARRETVLNEVAQQIKELGQEALVVPTDVTSQRQVKSLVAKTLAHWDRVDILVANAGQYVRRPVVELTVEDIERSMAVNFYGALYVILAVLPHMLARKNGHLVLISSMDGKKGIPPDAPYVAAKFALAGLAEVMRQELHNTGVYVTTVFPGRVDTPMIAHLKVPWISPKIPPDVVARAIVRGITHRQPEVIVPRLSYLLIYLNMISPRLGDWAVRFFRLEGQEEARKPR